MQEVIFPLLHLPIFYIESMECFPPTVTKHFFEVFLIFQRRFYHLALSNGDERSEKFQKK